MCTSIYYQLVAQYFVFVILIGYSFIASHKVHEADLMIHFNWRNVNNTYV